MGTVRSHSSNQRRHLFQDEIKRTPGSTDSTNRICIREARTANTYLSLEKAPLLCNLNTFRRSPLPPPLEVGEVWKGRETARLTYPGANLLDSQVLER